MTDPSAKVNTQKNDMKDLKASSFKYTNNKSFTSLFANRITAVLKIIQTQLHFKNSN